MTKSKKETALVKRPPGRPKMEMNWELIDDLCAIHCTQREVANIVKCSIETLNEKAKEKYKVTFKEYLERRRDKGRAALRREMWKQVEQGNITMMIFLSKNWLGMTDRMDVNAKQTVSNNATVVFESNGRELPKENKE